METVVDLPEPFEREAQVLDGRYGGVELRQAPCFEHGVVDTGNGWKFEVRSEKQEVK
jgi:hypothetical protein